MCNFLPFLLSRPSSFLSSWSLCAVCGVEEKDVSYIVEMPG